MSFDAADFLAGLFDGDLSMGSGLAGQETTPEVAVQVPMPVETDLTAALEAPPSTLAEPPFPEAMHAEDVALESVEPGEPCPKCRGLLWWEDLEDGRHCLDCERAGFERAEEIAGLAARLREASGLPPWETDHRLRECSRGCTPAEIDP
jgi:hypothetical protein